MSIDQEQYQNLIKDIELENVQLKDLKVQRAEIEQLRSRKVVVKIDFRMEEFRHTDKLVVFLAEFSIQALNAEHEETVLFDIEFVLELLYELKNSELYKSNSELLVHFAETNAPFNVWPYARELVASLSSRMGVQPLQLPMYKNISSETKDGNQV